MVIGCEVIEPVKNKTTYGFAVRCDVPGCRSVSEMRGTRAQAAVYAGQAGWQGWDDGGVLRHTCPRCLKGELMEVEL